MTTRSGAMTKPDPSCEVPHPSVAPVTLTVLDPTRAATSPISAATGGSTGTMTSGPTPSNTRGKPPATLRANPSAAPVRASGTTRSSARATVDDADRARQARHRRTADGGDHHREQHRHHEHGGHPAEGGVDDPGASLGQRPAAAPPERAADRLAPGGQHQDPAEDEQRTARTRLQVVGQDGHDEGPDDRAEHQPGHRQHAGERPAPHAVDQVGQQHGHQQDVDQHGLGHGGPRPRPELAHGSTCGRQVAQLRGRDRTHPALVPLPADAGGHEQARQQAGGEPPDEQAARRERRTAVRPGQHGAETVLGVEQLRQRHPLDPGHLGRVAHVEVVRALPPGHDGVDGEARRRQVQRREGAEQPHRRGVEPDLLLGLAQRRLLGALARLGRATGEGDLPGVRAHVGGALEQHDLAVTGRRPARTA